MDVCKKGESMKIAKTAPDTLRILWGDKFFVKAKNQKGD